MNNVKHGIAHRILAAFMALVLVFSTMPVTTLSVSAEEVATYGTVSTYTGGTVSGNGTDSVTVTVTETTLNWVAENDIRAEGWWVGISVTAPESMDTAALDNAQYRVNNGGGFGDWKSFADYKDGDRYIQLWFPVSPESLEKFRSEGRNLTMTYEFDWGGNGDRNQTVAFSVVPSEKIVLMKDGVQVYPEIQDTVVDYYGSVDTYTGGEVIDNNTQDVKVRITETTLNWVAGNDIRTEGWWVGISVTAPESMDAAALDNAQYRVNNGSGFGDWKSFADYKDGERYIQLWFPVSPESLEKFQSEGRDLTMTYEFDWSGNGDRNQTVTFSVVPSEKIVLMKDGDPVIRGVKIDAPGWTYDKEEHELVSVTAQEGDVITYKLNDGEITDTVPTATDAGTYVVTVYVAREGYKTLEKTVEVTVSEAALEGVTMTAVPGLKYNGEEHKLVVLEGIEPDDVLTWTVNGTTLETKDIPAFAGVGAYSVTLRVERKNYEKLEISVTAEIELGTIVLGNLEVIPLNAEYTGEAQKTLTVTLDAAAGYTLQYKLDDAEWTDEIPTVVNAGSYTVTVRAHQDGYNDYEVAYTVVVSRKQIEKPAADTTDFVYNGSEQTYGITESALYTITGNKQTNAGEYTVVVSLNDKANYAWADGTTDGTTEDLTYTFTIKKASQSLKFNKDEYINGGSQNVNVSGTATFTFLADILSGYNGNTVEYSISFGEGTAENIASIDGSGNLTVSGAGIVTVTATLNADEYGNYEAASISYTLYITQIASLEHPLIKFDGNVEYTFGENAGVVSDQTVIKTHDDDKDPTYKLDRTDVGLTIGEDTGVVSIDSYETLKAKLSETGTLVVTVTATKEAEEKFYGSGFFGWYKYGPAEVSYQITITFQDTPDSAYVLSGTKGTIDGVDTDWYVSAVTVTPAEGYTIATSCNPDSFGDKVVFDESNAVDKVYLRNKETGGITAAIPVNVNVDTKIEKPVITYSEPDGVEELLEMITFGFYQSEATVFIELADATSGVDHFDYSYTVEDGASEINKGTSGTITAENITYDENSVATASFKIPAQFRGKISVTATDKAGNTSSEAVYGTDIEVVVVDNIAPGVSVSYNKNYENDYYNEERIATIYIDEANFFEEDLTDERLAIAVGTEYNDGTSKSENVKPTFQKISSADDEYNSEFDKDADGFYYKATIAFNENADYTFDIQYTDRSGNVYDDYEIDDFTVDLIDPIIAVTVTNDDVRNEKYFNKERTAEIKVTEHNFDPAGFVATVTENGVAVQKELEWNTEGDVHTATIEFPGDAHYTLEVACTDLSGRIDEDGADYGESVAPTAFTVDKTPPTDLTITYSEPVSVWDDLLEAITFGFYQAQIEVTIQATDPIAGVDYFEYSYVVEAGASEINQGASGKITAENITYDENGVATATFEIPAQFRGYVSFTAYDKAGNSDSKSDEKVETIVADTTPPVVEVTYDNNNVKNGKYYSADRTATIKIKEANFFGTEEWELADFYDLVPGTDEEYLVITVTKKLYDGTETTTKVKPVFTKDGDSDVYIATVEFNENADYTFDIKYTDRSGNVYDSYETDIFVIDKVQPKISVSYIDTVPALNDNYYKADRVAVFTVVEHNFRASDIDFTISATDVTGTKNIDLSAKGYAAYLQEQSNWTKSGDTWTTSIPLDIEGNYKLGMEYADLAGIDQEKKIDDAFCIDKSDPAALTISYSPDFVGQLLENVTFGFYKAPVTVTITATDEYAGVDYFTYSYPVDADASDINTGKTDVVISRNDIDYDGNKATATFEIPAQYRGHVSFVVTDKAGNDKNLTAGEMIVVDDKAPVVDVVYDNNNALYDNYYDADRTATITITEANFFAADQADGYLVITVGKTLNDGTYTETIVQPTFTSNGDVHTATVKFDENADYTFDIKYTDRSGNVFDSYEMDTFTIDKIAPVIDITYSNNIAKNNDQFQADRVANIVITEHNFKASDVAATVMASAEPFNGTVSSESYKLVESYAQYLTNDANWKHEGDVHTTVIEYTEEAHYTFAIAYSDMAGNDNVGVNYGDSVAPEKFTLDKSAPNPDLEAEEMKITIDGVSVRNKSEDNSVIFDTFYDEQIVIKLDANCDISGLESLQYQKVNAVSEYVVNGTWTAYDAEKGIVVDPSEKLVIFFRAEDRAGNVTIVNSTGIVVDDQMPIGETNAPEIDILPAAPNANGFHNGNVVVDLKVVDPKYAGGSANEAGFYSGLSKITYRIYTTDTDAVEEGILLDLIDATEGAVYDGDNLVSTWSGKITIDSTKFNSNNVIVEVSATDNAGNIRTTSTTVGDIQIDITAPQIDISYNNNNPDSGSYYNADRTATITVTERNFDARDVVITITNTDNVIPDIPAVLLDWNEVVGTGNQDNTTYTATIVYSADGDYTFDIGYTDEAGNVCTGANYVANTQNATEFTIDKTNPVILVSYDNNNAENEKYFDAIRTATVTITEHNFDVDRVSFIRDAARGGANPEIAWTHSGDTHIATITYSADGDYTFDVTMADMAGNVSGAADYGTSVAGKDFILDITFDDMITIGGVESGMAYGYSDDVIPTIDISDINLENYTVSLVGVQKDTTIDLSDKINALLNADTENVTGTFDVFEVVQDLDGIYTLKITSQDKAGNQDVEEITFTVNRFGSVYVYDEYLLDLISDGGAYVLRVTDDIIIDEYNADKLVSDSLVIEITRDGKPLDNVIFAVTPEINDAVSVGESGWYQYKYTISKENFITDGVYKISVSSKDATGNAPENNNYEDLDIMFRVDGTLAEISSIVGLEEAIIDATEQVVKYTVFDTMGIKSIKVYVDDQLVDEITDFSADLNNYSGSFTLSEQSTAQSIRIVVEDMSGNVTDTDAETFSSAYEFNKAVTVSTNIFVRWYANKPLFWGSIGGVTVAAAGLWFFLVAKRKKKEEVVAK